MVWLDMPARYFERLLTEADVSSAGHDATETVGIKLLLSYHVQSKRKVRPALGIDNSACPGTIPSAFVLS